jgi:hypothetical protein
MTEARKPPGAKPTPHEKRFPMLANDIWWSLTRLGLSAEAWAVLIILLTETIGKRPKGPRAGHVSQRQIMKRSGLSRRRAAAGLAELQDTGAVAITPARRGSKPVVTLLFCRARSGADAAVRCYHCNGLITADEQDSDEAVYAEGKGLAHKRCLRKVSRT